MPPKDYYTKDGSVILGSMKSNIDDFAKFYANMVTLSNLYEILSEKADKKDEEDFNKLNKEYYS